MTDHYDHGIAEIVGSLEVVLVEFHDPYGSDAYKGNIKQCDYKQRFAELVAQHCNNNPCVATFESSSFGS